MTTENESAPSPLSEAKTDSLDEQIRRFDEHIKARTLTSQEATTVLDKIVEALRAQRANWATAEANGAKRAPRGKKAPASELTSADLANMNLDELDL